MMMVVLGGIPITHGAPLLIRLLPFVYLLGLLLPSVVQVLRYTGGPTKAPAQGRTARRRLAREHRKATPRAAGHRAWSWPVDTAPPQEKATVAYWFTQILDVLSGTKPWEDCLPQSCDGACDALVRWIRSLAGTPGTAQPTAAAEPKKRKREPSKQRSKKNRTHGNSDREGEGTGDEDGDGQQAPDVTDGDECGLGGKYWACPFYLFDPEGHYDCVQKHKLKRVSDVKLHMERKHAREHFYDCPRCWERWPKPDKPGKQDKFRAAYDSHVRREDCQGLSGTQGLNDDEVKILKEKVLRGVSPRDQWYWIWGQFFPGHEPPESPYVQDGLNEPRALLLRNALHMLRTAPPPSPVDLEQFLDSSLNAPSVPGRRRRLAAADTSPGTTQNIPAAPPEAMPADVGQIAVATMTPGPQTAALDDDQFNVNFNAWLHAEYLDSEAIDGFDVHALDYDQGCA